VLAATETMKRESEYIESRRLRRVRVFRRIVLVNCESVGLKVEGSSGVKTVNMKSSSCSPSSSSMLIVLDIFKQ
jgi:hypothetical protein